MTKVALWIIAPFLMAVLWIIKWSWLATVWMCRLTWRAFRAIGILIAALFSTQAPATDNNQLGGDMKVHLVAIPLAVSLGGITIVMADTTSTTTTATTTSTTTTSTTTTPGLICIRPGVCTIPPAVIFTPPAAAAPSSTTATGIPAPKTGGAS